MIWLVDPWLRWRWTSRAVWECLSCPSPGCASSAHGFLWLAEKGQSCLLKFGAGGVSLPWKPPWGEEVGFRVICAAPDLSTAFSSIWKVFKSAPRRVPSPAHWFSLLLPGSLICLGGNLNISICAMVYWEGCVYVCNSCPRGFHLHCLISWN